MTKRSSARDGRSRRNRYLKNLTLSFLGLIILPSLLLWPVSVNPEQQIEFFSTQIWFDQNVIYDLDSLTALYGEKKDLPRGFEKQSLLALSRFPELRDTRITFKVSPALIPVACRPNYFSLFKGQQNRRYNVWISSKSRMVPEGVLLHNLPFNAQVSMLAHELGHTYYYEKLSIAEFIKFGFCYLVNSNYRAKHERTTDKLVISRGLGKGLLENAEFIRDHPETSDYFSEEGNFLDTYYLTPTEILHILENYR